jgi:hypothetical protein
MGTELAVGVGVHAEVVYGLGSQPCAAALPATKATSSGLAAVAVALKADNSLSFVNIAGHDA